MKEITITQTVKVPTENELKAVAKNASPIKPRQAIIVNCFVYGYEFESEENKAVYECMKEAEAFRRNNIASDVAAAYCDENNIKWCCIRILSVSEYNKHFAIEALVEPRA